MAKNFSRDLADKLLDKLSHDDDFRAQFQRDPYAAMESLGYQTDQAQRGVEGADPVVCCAGLAGNLASKDDIRKARGKLREQLTSVPFHYAVSI
jgi:putative modified peptide